MGTVRSRRLGHRRRRQESSEARKQRASPDRLRHGLIKMRPMLAECAPPIVVRRALARIGPQGLELDAPPNLGDRPAATQNRGTLSQQARPLKSTFPLRVYHRSDQSEDRRPLYLLSSQASASRNDESSCNGAGAAHTDRTRSARPAPLSIPRKRIAGRLGRSGSASGVPQPVPARGGALGNGNRRGYFLLLSAVARAEPEPGRMARPLLAGRRRSWKCRQQLCYLPRICRAWPVDQDLSRSGRIGPISSLFYVRGA